jgi:hypothetical protein
VLQTPRKYRIGRPPCMFGRSHVNILAHPDRFRWSDHRCALSPLAFALCSQAASGYRKLQLNRLFLGSATSSHSDPPGFMVLTGRWNRCLEDEDHNDWKVDSPPRRSQHRHHALEAVFGLESWDVRVIMHVSVSNVVLICIDLVDTFTIYLTNQHHYS